jgi:FkbM family methyltransferase
MLLSYAQRLEDYHLALAFDGQPEGVYVDVGAGHPVADNVSYWFYLRGWSGLVVEPQEALLSLYARLRPRDRRASTLLGRQKGEAAFHVFDRLHGLSTMLPAKAREAAVYDPSYRTERRTVTTLAELCGSHGLGRIDFLKIDVEGAEGDVLAGADWERWRPRIILAEVISPGISADEPPPWEDLLLSRGYRFALFDSLNRFYVAEEETELAARLPRTPSGDAVPQLHAFGRATRNPSHPDHVLASRLVAGFLARLPHLETDEVVSLLCAAPGPLPTGDALRRLLLGAAPEAQDPPPPDRALPPEEACRTLLRTDEGRAALGRIASAFDGGLILRGEEQT